MIWPAVPSEPGDVVVDHLLGALAHRQKDSGEIDVEDFLEIHEGHLLGHLAGFLVGRDHHAVLDDPGKRGDEIDRPHLFHDISGERRIVFLFGDVADKGFNVPAQLLLGGCQGTLIDIGDDRLAVGGKRRKGGIFQEHPVFAPVQSADMDIGRGLEIGAAGPGIDDPCALRMNIRVHLLLWAIDHRPQPRTVRVLDIDAKRPGTVGVKEDAAGRQSLQMSAPRQFVGAVGGIRRLCRRSVRGQDIAQHRHCR